MGMSTGIDITAVKRFEGKDSDRAFLERLLTESEMRDVLSRPRPATGLAVIFAAKEAVMKAIGTGWDKGVGWRDIEVSARMGAPVSVTLHAAALEAVGGRRVLLSVAHTGTLAIGFAIVEGLNEVSDNNPRL